MYTIIANIIDDGFANRYSIDVIAAYGSYLPIAWTFQCFYNIGKYAYSNTLKNPKTCLLLGLSVNIVALIILLPFHQYIHVIYHLSQSQIKIFDWLVLLYLITSPLRQIGDFLCLVLMYDMKNKNVIIADILFWTTNLTLDVVVYFFRQPVWYLVITTAVGYFIYDIYLLVTSNILKDKIVFSFIPETFKKGFDIVIDRLTGKVATLAYGSLASKLPEYDYAIHCIVYGVICNCEEFTNNFNIYCRTRLASLSNKIQTGSQFLIKKYGVILICIEYVVSIFYLILYHGKIEYIDCFPWLLLYMSDAFSLMFYESFKAVLSCYERTDYLRYGGLFGIVVRIPYTYMTFKMGWGLFGFATAYTLDFGIRAVYFNKMITRCEKQQ